MISDPRKFVRTWLTKHGVTIDERGGLQSEDNRDNIEIFKTLYLDYCEQISCFNYKADKKIKREGKDIVQDALEELISIHVSEERKKIFESIKSIGTNNLIPLKNFIQAVTGNTEPSVVAVMAHYLWNIKRRMIGKDTSFQLMPILFGAQNGGKSIAVKRLLSPLNTLSQCLSLPAVIDPRAQMSFSKTFAVIVDEMAGAHKTDVDALKNLITATDMDIRKLHTNTVIKVKQNVNLIGTTNRPVAEIIYDPTGSRRFYEIRTLPKLDWNTINSINYLELWQGINENKDRGYYEEFQKEIVAEQQDLIGLEELQVFLDFHKVKPGIRELSAQTLYETYRRWCETNGVNKPINSIWFGRKLSGKGFKKPTQKSIRGKNTLVYLIGEESDLHAKSTYDPLGMKEFQ
jgi:hypothetical protein